MVQTILIKVFLISTLSISLNCVNAKLSKQTFEDKSMKKKNLKTIETATLGGGCFWCIEAIFEELDGVVEIVSGYSGGKMKNPTYIEISYGDTKHAEVCQITYNTEKITFKDLLEVFFQVHDPTTLNKQGPDVGPQYRSVIFYHNDNQKETAEDIIKALDKSGAYENPVVTEVAPFKSFYLAENLHQNYYEKFPNQPYCRIVIKPKMDKFKKIFSDKLKK